MRPVTQRLLAQGHPVAVPPVFNRSLSGDSAYIKSFVEQIEGPVLLVGHSYGGAVITVAGDAENVVGLVYVCAYALDEGESLGELQGGFPDSELAENLVYAPYPVDGVEPGTDVSVKVDAFPRVFAAGVPEETAAVLAVSQRPLAAVAFGEPASVAALEDQAGLGNCRRRRSHHQPRRRALRLQRAGLRKVVEIDSPHLAMFTHPDAITDLIAIALADVAQASPVG